MTILYYYTSTLSDHISNKVQSKVEMQKVLIQSVNVKVWLSAFVHTKLTLRSHGS